VLVLRSASRFGGVDCAVPSNPLLILVGLRSSATRAVQLDFLYHVIACIGWSQQLGSDLFFHNCSGRIDRDRRLRRKGRTGDFTHGAGQVNRRCCCTRARTVPPPTPPQRTRSLTHDTRLIRTPALSTTEQWQPPLHQRHGCRGRLLTFRVSRRAPHKPIHHQLTNEGRSGPPMLSSTPQRLMTTITTTILPSLECKPAPLATPTIATQQLPAPVWCDDGSVV
jgi:hypothetical protein